MDWAKAKNVLIIIFFALNVFLLVNLSGFYFGESISKETISNTTAVLKKRGVDIKCEIPRDTAGAFRLVYENGGYGRAAVVKKLLGIDIPAGKIKAGEEIVNGSKKLILDNDNSFIYTNSVPDRKINTYNKHEVEEYARAFLAGLGLPFREYRRDVFKRNHDKSVDLVFVEKIRKFLVFDNRVKMVISHYGLIYMECRFKKIKSLAPDKVSNKEIAAAYLVLVKNFNDAENITVTGIDIGFRGPAPEKEARVVSVGPVWRIRLEDGAERYFGAYDGEEE